MTESNVLGISRFPISKLKPDRRVLIVGKPGTGKTTLLKDLLSYINTCFDFVIGMTKTADTAKMFAEFMPESLIYRDFNAKVLDEFMDTIEKLNDNGKFRRVAVILDDCMDEKKVMTSKTMRTIHMNGRHCDVLFVSCVQYLMDYPKPLRACIDYVFALREPNRSNRENLYKNFFGIFDRYDEFAYAMAEFTSNRECLVVDNTSIENDISKVIFWYKANPNIPKYVMGSRTAWRLHYHFYEPISITLPDNPIPAFAPKGVQQSNDLAYKKGSRKKLDMVIEKRDEKGKRMGSSQTLSIKLPN